MFREFLIAGNGPAGLYAARVLRRLSRDRILVVSSESHPGYSRCLLPNVLKGEREEKDIAMFAQEWYQRNGIELLAGVKVCRVDTAKKTVLTDNGREIRYGRLLIATGADPVMPGIKGITAEGVYGFRTILHLRRMIRDLDRIDRAVIMGGGFVGLKVAEALTHRGIKVSVIEKLPRLLPRMLDETAAGLIENHLARAGVEVITGQGIIEIAQKSGRVCGVITEDGIFIESGLVVVAVGVEPNVDLVGGSRIKLKRGILVDDFMQTSEACVFAAGDVAVAADYKGGTYSYNPIWPNATAQARIAALNMLGYRFRYEGNISRNSVSLFNLPVMTGGITWEEDGMRQLVEVYHSERNVYRKVNLSPDGSVSGFMAVGDLRGVPQIFREIRKQSRRGDKLYRGSGTAALIGGSLNGCQYFIQPYKN
ncbi:MAG: FAD-dependent oxidoreductase [Peptococcaceae bacterium]|nr:FAD-dependent oxidoreductase [Peptococcaceae bacterium]